MRKFYQWLGETIKVPQGFLFIILIICWGLGAFFGYLWGYSHGINQQPEQYDFFHERNHYLAKAEVLCNEDINGNYITAWQANGELLYLSEEYEDLRNDRVYMLTMDDMATPNDYTDDEILVVWVAVD